MAVVLRTFRAAGDAIGATRRFVEEHLVRLGVDDQRIDAAVLCASELATNAVLHSERDFDVEISTDDPIRVTVRDRETGRLPVLQRTAPLADHGRGLQVVGLFAERWGYDLEDEAKAVWFEIGCTDEPRRAGGALGRRRSDQRV